jgi:hypothetical protein
MKNSQITSQKTLTLMAIAACFVAVAVIFVIFFQNLPTDDNTLGIDNIFSSLKHGDIHYDVGDARSDGLRNPPWSVLVLLPLGFLSNKAAWGLLVYFTLVVLIVSVPPARQKWLYWLSIFLLITAFPTLRNIADANLEGLVIAGGILLVAGYQRRNPYVVAAGVLLTTAKPQASILLILVAGIYMLQTWSVREWMKAGIAVLVVVIPTFIWRGADWLAAMQGTYQAGSIIDVSLSAALERADFAPTFAIHAAQGFVLVVTVLTAWYSQRTLSREKAGMLIACGLLLAPYAAGNSVGNVLAVGVVPLLIVSPALGIALIALMDFPFLWSTETLVKYQSYWWTFILLLTWAIINWRVYRNEIQPNTASEQTSSQLRAEQSLS